MPLLTLGYSDPIEPLVLDIKKKFIDASLSDSGCGEAMPTHINRLESYLADYFSAGFRFLTRGL